MRNFIFIGLWQPYFSMKVLRTKYQIDLNCYSQEEKCYVSSIKEASTKYQSNKYQFFQAKYTKLSSTQRICIMSTKLTSTQNNSENAAKFTMM